MVSVPSTTPPCIPLCQAIAHCHPAAKPLPQLVLLPGTRCPLPSSTHSHPTAESPLPLSEVHAAQVSCEHGGWREGLLLPRQRLRLAWEPPGSVGLEGICGEVTSAPLPSAPSGPSPWAPTACPCYLHYSLTRNLPPYLLHWRTPGARGCSPRGEQRWLA